MAKVDGTSGSVSAFTSQPKLTNGAAEHKVVVPAVAGGHGLLFVAGGRVDYHGQATDVVVVAKLAADGAVTAVSTGPPLPRALHDLALVAHGDKLYALGGRSAASRTAD